MEGAGGHDIRLLGAGLDHVAFEVDGTTVVRFSVERDAAARAARTLAEARLLDLVARVSPVPAPRPAFVAPERGCMVYPKLPGMPLLEVDASRRAAHAPAIGAVLGGLLVALHAVPAEEVHGLVAVDDQPLDGWRAEARAHHEAVAAHLPAPHREAVEAFLAAPPPEPAGALAFTHDDLGIEHVLVDPVSLRVTGVIDWSDAAIADPARDLGLLLRDLGPAALDAALHARDGGETADLARRAGFHARCALLEDLAYGLDAGARAYVDKSLAALAWLFPG